MTKFFGNITTEGKLLISGKPQFDAEIKKLSGKKISLDLKEHTAKDIRSLNQNAYYWSVVLKALTDNGEDEIWWHRYCKVKFILPKLVGRKIDLDEVQPDKVRELAKYLTTTILKTNQFEEYLAEIRAWASQKHNIIIPEPNEVPLIIHSK